MSRYQTTRTRGGAVVQSGIDIRRRGQDLSPSTPRLGLYRGLVIKTYAPRTTEGEASADVRRGNQVECDVLLVRSHGIVKKAPVLQRAFGVNEAHGPWIPRPATRTLDGSPLNFQVLGEDGRFEGVATSFENTDGDMVIVEFVEGNVDYPVITGSITHERTARFVRAPSDTKSGWAEGDDDRGHMYQGEYYTHHHGTEIRVNPQGDVLIDTVGAYQDRATEDPSAAGGDVRVRVKEGQRLTIALGSDEDTLEVWKDGGQVRIDLGEDADERVILGDGFRQFFNDWLEQEYYLHTHPTGVGPSDKTIQQLGTKMGEDLLSDLSKTKKS